jgi:hypothetical protein
MDVLIGMEMLWAERPMITPHSAVGVLSRSPVQLARKVLFPSKLVLPIYRRFRTFRCTALSVAIGHEPTHALQHNREDAEKIRSQRG